MSLVAGAALGWFAEVNVLGDLIPVLIECIVAPALVGGCSQIVHAVVNKSRAPLYPEVEP